MIFAVLAAACGGGAGRPIPDTRVAVLFVFSYVLCQPDIGSVVPSFTGLVTSLCRLAGGRCCHLAMTDANLSWSCYPDLKRRLAAEPLLVLPEAMVGSDPITYLNIHGGIRERRMATDNCSSAQ